MFNRQINLKSLVCLTIFLFIFLFSGATKLEAAVLNWENPNSKVSPYKVKITDIVNADLFGQILGCTGFVNTFSTAFTDLTSSAWDSLVMGAKLTNKIKAQCDRAGGKVATVTAGTETSQTPSAGKTTAIVNGIKYLCQSETKTTMGTFDYYWENKKENREKAELDYAQCLKGVAFTLAKNQLTSMTRYAINWVNSGFGGDPFFVQNTQSFLDNIERNLFEEALNYLMPTTDGAYPYSNAFARAFVNDKSIKRSGVAALQNLTSTLSYFVTDPRSYLSNEQLNNLENHKQTELEKSRRAVELYYDSFNRGGWDAWGAFTQNEADNPLGYFMSASDIIHEDAFTRKQEVKEELIQNDGFLSQRMCVEYSKEETKDQISAKAPLAPICEDTRSQECKNLQENYRKQMTDYQNTTNSKAIQPRVCIKWETVTPGSIIKDKTSHYLNSPERQLELADDINHVLNSVFSMLVSKLESQGLSGINTKESFVYEDDRFNWTSGLSTSRALDAGESLTTGYTNGSFDLTRDLGNRFIFGITKENNLGTWDVTTNIATQKNGARENLVEGIGPLVIKSDGSINYPLNVYYVVSKPGRAKLFDNGYTYWEVGDRAFWDGEKWQNWKKCKTNMEGKCISETYPIRKRGVIQIQYDYIVAAKEILQKLPSIMPKIGELDYCLPGPNRNWLLNIEEYQNAMVDFVYSLKTTTTQARWFKRGYTDFGIAKPGEDTFDKYLNVFKDTPSMLNGVTVGFKDMVTYGSGKISNTSTWREIINTGNIRTEKINLKENHLIEKVDMLISAIEDGIKQFEKDYSSIVNFLYGTDGLVNIEYFIHEDTAEKIPNSAYLPVGKVAYPIAGQIMDYNQEITDKINAYKDNIATVQAGVYELEKIKTEVDKIIKAAQQRRDARMIEILNEEAERRGGKIMELSAYKNKYSSCLETEQIIFYDDLEIMNGDGNTEDRCYDGLDNDFDGLTDSLDPDCSRIIRGSTTPGGTMNPSGDAFSNTGGDAFSDQNNNQGSGAFRR